MHYFKSALVTHNLVMHKGTNTGVQWVGVSTYREVYQRVYQCTESRIATTGRDCICSCHGTSQLQCRTCLLASCIMNDTQV